MVKVPSVEICENIKFKKSYLQILIDMYENMRVENESVIVLNEKCDNSEYGQSEAAVSGPKPNGATPSSRPVCVIILTFIIFIFVCVMPEWALWLENGCGG